MFRGAMELVAYNPVYHLIPSRKILTQWGLGHPVHSVKSSPGNPKHGVLLSAFCPSRARCDMFLRISTCHWWSNAAILCDILRFLEEAIGNPARRAIQPMLMHSEGTFDGITG